MIRKRSIKVAGKLSSITLEDLFFAGLNEIAEARKATLQDLVTTIDAARPHGANLSSAVRQFVLQHYVNAAHASRNPAGTMR